MAYAAIMVAVEPNAGADPRIALAQTLADRFDAALIGIAAEAPITVTANDGSASTQARANEFEHQRVATNLAEAEQRFRAVLQPQSHSKAEWRRFTEHPGRALAREARSADLLVIGAGGRIDAGDVLLTAGRPVLVTPAGVRTVQARQVVIGWRDSAPSRRAVSDALPLLRRAEGVLVLAIAGEDTDSAGETEPATEAVVAFLARHGVSAEGDVRVQHGDSVTQALIRAAEERRADLIIAGAYGHARALEWTYGGVTRALLTQCPMCCLLSH